MTIPWKEQLVLLKDSDDIVDYLIDWSQHLASGETISSASFIVESGLTKDSETNSTTTATVWVSGGTAGKKYTVECTIETSASRTISRSFIIHVKEL